MRSCARQREESSSSWKIRGRSQSPQRAGDLVDGFAVFACDGLEDGFVLGCVVVAFGGDFGITPFHVLWVVPSTPAQRSVLVPVTFSLIELPLRLVVTVSRHVLRVAGPLVVVPDAFVATLSV